MTRWILSLTQFYLSLGFALIFLMLELGLAWVLLIYRIRAKHSVAALYAYRFWVRVFALCCVLAFAASVPLILNIGIIWPKFMSRMGEVAGPLIGLAILTTFIFKSCFLGLMLYGQRILPDFTHTLSIFMVAIGSSLSCYWGLVFLAWQAEKPGAVLNEGHYIVTDWWLVLSANSAWLFGLLWLSSLLLVLVCMFAVLARISKIRPSDQGDNSVYKFAVKGLPIGLVIQLGFVYVLGLIPDISSFDLRSLADNVVLYLYIINFILGICLLYAANKSSYDLDGISSTKRFLIRLLALLVFVVQIYIWAKLFNQALPYSAHQYNNLRDMVAVNNPKIQFSLLVAQFILYAVLLIGLRNLIINNIRFGVIPVSRHRGRA